MENRYQELIENVSAEIAQELLEDQQLLDEEHRLRLDGVMFELMMQVGLAALNQLLEHMIAAQVDEKREEGMHINDNKVIDVHTRLGTCSVSSPYLRNRKTGESTRPAKDVYGLRGGGKTLELERALADFGSEDSYAQAEQMFEEHYGFNIGRTSILRVTREVGEDAESFLEERFEQMATPYGLPRQQRSHTAEELLVELDGCLIRTGKLMSARQAGMTKEDGVAPDDMVRVEEWREVRVGLVRKLDELRPSYVCRLGDYDTICDQMFSLAVERGLDADTVVVGCSDGANGLRDGLAVVFPNLVYILDYSHLKNHFFETAEALGIDEEMRSKWVYSFVDELWQEEVDDWEEQVEAVIERLRTLHIESENPRLKRLIDHLDNFSNAVAYQYFDDQDWPTGSGEIESAHRHIPQARLKLPGACWRVENINPMMAIRVIKKNGWWSEFWQWREQQALCA